MTAESPNKLVLNQSWYKLGSLKFASWNKKRDALNLSDQRCQEKSEAFSEFYSCLERATLLLGTRVQYYWISK